MFQYNNSQYCLCRSLIDSVSLCWSLMVSSLSSSVHGTFHSHQEEVCLKRLDDATEPQSATWRCATETPLTTAVASSLATTKQMSHHWDSPSYSAPLWLQDDKLKQRRRVSNTRTCCFLSDWFNLQTDSRMHGQMETDGMKKTDSAQTKNLLNCVQQTLRNRNIHLTDEL